MVQQLVVTIPPSRVALAQLMVAVVQYPLPSMWTPQFQNPSNMPFQSTVGAVPRPLVDVNQPHVGGKYNIWSQPPITRDKFLMSQHLWQLRM